MGEKMKTIVGLFWGVFAGAFCGIGIIAFITVMGVGAEQLGFTKYTLYYYVISLCLSATLLIGSKAARQQIKFMLFFVIAVLMVFSIGFVTFNEPSTGSDQLAQIQETLLNLARFLAIAFMYVVPGALTIYYAYTAYDGLSRRAVAAQAIFKQAE